MSDENADQLDRNDLAGMTLEEINEARKAGRLRALMENPDFVWEPSTPSLSEAAVATHNAKVAASNQYEKFREDPVGFIRDTLSGPDPRQLSREDLAEMSFAEINKAWHEGRLTAVMGIE
ncbi:hypothetical protein ACIG5D_36450 [Microbispora rosea]|uniref:hypothetical protein n=1 Tax=Microbispora rosea TaxID=58117 RepID=UPI0037CA9BB0